MPNIIIEKNKKETKEIIKNRCCWCGSKNITNKLFYYCENCGETQWEMDLISKDDIPLKEYIKNKKLYNKLIEEIIELMK